MTNPLDSWVAELAEALDVPPEAVDRDLLLAVARDAAHHVARPAAPLTTFLVGLAAGRAGADAASVRAAAAIASALANCDAVPYGAGHAGPTGAGHAEPTGAGHAEPRGEGHAEPRGPGHAEPTDG